MKVVSADIVAEAVERIGGTAGGTCVFKRTDLRSDSDIDDLVAETVDRYAGINFLINVACTYADDGPESTRALWRDGFDVNLFGHVGLLQRAMPYLKDADRPSVVFFASNSGRVAMRGPWVYQATTAALEQVTRRVAIDLAAFGIRVNAVMPGWSEKPWRSTALDEIKQHYRHWGGRLHMLGRQGTMREIAEAVLLLCSEHVGFVTGACIAVDVDQSTMGPQGHEMILPAAGRDAATRW